MNRATTNEVAQRLERLRLEGGAVALGRVLTLVIVLDGSERLDAAIEAADAASLEHPCRVLVLCAHDGPAPDGGGIDAEIRVGGDAGASETVIVRLALDKAHDLDVLLSPLLLPDAPIVAWWPGEAPDVPAEDPIGAMATRRITDSCACSHPVAALQRAARGYRPGDTDLAWTRITLWRAQLAAAFAVAAGARVTNIQVAGNPAHPSCHLLERWLSDALTCPGRFDADGEAEAITAARIEWATDGPASTGLIELSRPDGSDVATLTIGAEVPHDVALPLRTLPECLAEELRRLDPDEVYGAVARSMASRPLEADNAGGRGRRRGTAS